MRVVVVGGGITGLATAWHLRDEAEVTVLEATGRVGGQVRTVELGGGRLDVGADAMLARQPEGVALVRSLGLGDDLVEPAASRVWLWVRGRLRPLPEGTVMGAPSSPLALARSGVLPPGALLRAVAEPLLPRGRLGDDCSVAELVGRRFGRAVAEQLVEPLVSGVYAGSVDRLSAAATAAPLWAAARDHRRLTFGLLAQRRRPAAEGPAFQSVRGGLGRVTVALADALGSRVRPGLAARTLARTASGWQVRTDEGSLEADHVVLALPAAPAALLLADTAPQAARLLDGLATASVAVVALAYDHDDVAGTREGSGVLVPRTEGRLIKAATFSARKWPQLAEAERFLLRASVGRVDDPRGLDLDDEELATRVDAEVRQATGIRGPAREHRVVRWDHAMPQYDVGHLDRVAAIRDALSVVDGLHLGGAALDGVGLPARARDAQRLADEVRSSAPSRDRR